MTFEQTQGTIERLNHIHEMLINMLTTLNIALDLFEDLPTEEKRWLHEYCQQEQLRVLDQMSNSFNHFAYAKSIRCM